VSIAAEGEAVPPIRWDEQYETFSIGAGIDVDLRIIGRNLNYSHTFALSAVPNTCTHTDLFSATDFRPSSDPSELGSVGMATVRIHVGGPYYLCLDGTSYGAHHLLLMSHSMEPKGPSGAEAIPLGVRVLMMLVLLCLAALFSGLNLGLMALDTTGLRIVMESGSAKDREYARSIYPLRKRGNYLLCTILLGNVLVNNSLTIILDTIIGGLGAVLGSTAAIVILGEIIPQAICSRHGLMIGAKTAWIMRMFMVMMFPVAFPVSFALDWWFGEEIGQVYNRKELMALLRETRGHHDMNATDLVMLEGALDFRQKTVEQIMTRLDHVVMVNANAALDLETMAAIVQAGHSRIPVFEGDRSNVVGLLMVRDLLFVDAAMRISLRTFMQTHYHPVHFVLSDVHLDRMLDEFKEGHTHLAMVRRIIHKDDGDPTYETVGIVTLEDLFEEIIQAEIYDEKDNVGTSVSVRLFICVCMCLCVYVSVSVCVCV
jgi:metal transporter CNNM